MGKIAIKRLKWEGKLCEAYNFKANLGIRIVETINIEKQKWMEGKGIYIYGGRKKRSSGKWK